jgi:hypothetical protein
MGELGERGSLLRTRGFRASVIQSGHGGFSVPSTQVATLRVAHPACLIRRAATR